MSKLSFQELVAILVNQDLLMVTDDNQVVTTNRFYEKLKWDIPTGLKLSDAPKLTPEKRELPAEKPPKKEPVTKQSTLHQLIKESGAPTMIDRGDGTSYRAAFYTKSGESLLKRTLFKLNQQYKNKEVVWKVFVICTRLYYMYGNKSTILNFLKEEMWLSDFDILFTLFEEYASTPSELKARISHYINETYKS